MGSADIDTIVERIMARFTREHGRPPTHEELSGLAAEAAFELVGLTPDDWQRLPRKEAGT